MFYYDPVTGQNRLKRRYVWCIYGFLVGVPVGLSAALLL
jgi:hypothetical protein